MSRILLVDPAEIAQKAMRGILARGCHRFAAVSTVDEAWQFIQNTVEVDLVIAELKVEGGGGLRLVERLRADCLLKFVPVVIYAGAAERESVRRAMELKIQNFLVKPYRDDHIFAEIAKARANPWRNRHFEEEKSFCAMMGYTPESLRKTLSQLQSSLELASGPLLEEAKQENIPGAVSRVNELAGQAEAAGAWGVVEILTALRENAEQRLWPAYAEGLRMLPLAERLIFAHVNPDTVPEAFISHEERTAAEEARARAVWFDAPKEGRCPVVGWPQLERELDGLNGFPVIDSVAASFQMSATGHPSSLAPLMDLSEKDPGLSAHLLVAANQLRSADELDPEPVENPRLCIGLLGEIKLAAIGAKLLTTPERAMNIPPCSWRDFWVFQVGVARMARYTCRYLEFHSLESRAYAAGLLHDLGKLLLVHLHPLGFEAVLNYAREEHLPLGAAEQKFFGCTTREIAAHFATRHGLLPSYVNVMRWVDDPAQSIGDGVLVAAVSLARELCRQNRVGWSGDAIQDEPKPLSETAGWHGLSSGVFPSFNLDKFEAEAHAECRDLKAELLGQASTILV